MGGSRMAPSSWTAYASTNLSGKSTTDIYTSKSIHADLNPKNINRESVDSDANPNSTAIIIALDVTGSMDPVLDSAIRSVGNLFRDLYERKPVSDPHIMFMGIGDVHANDIAPLQVTQFEADIVLCDQLSKIWLERRGGGNNFEGYALAWFFAAMHTETDCFSKRNKKGYLFTIGDEEPTPNLLQEHILKVMGDHIQVDSLSAQALLDMASQRYEVFHIMIKEGYHFRCHGDIVQSKWLNLLGQRAILLDDHTKLSEVIISTIQANEGIEKDVIIKSWDGSTGVTVANAIQNLCASQSVNGDVVEFD